MPHLNGCGGCGAPRCSKSVKTCRAVPKLDAQLKAEVVEAICTSMSPDLESAVEIPRFAQNSSQTLTRHRTTPVTVASAKLQRFKVSHELGPCGMRVIPTNTYSPISQDLACVLLKEQIASTATHGTFYPLELALDPKAVQELPVGTFAQVTGAWTVEGEEIVDALKGLHVWSKVWKPPAFFLRVPEQECAGVMLYSTFYRFSNQTFAPMVCRNLSSPGLVGDQSSH
eukprot:1136917-Pelagomonas_calceolata.AAC.2